MKSKKAIFYLILLVTVTAFHNFNGENDVIQKNTYTLNSVSPTDENFSDLEFFKDKLKDKKIILLGESGHGDGTTFEAKTRLIKFLHEKLDYNVLAFEGATIFDLYFAGSVIKRGKTPEIAQKQLLNGLFKSWSASKEFQELANYIGQNIDSLNLIGIDNNFAMTGYAHYFPNFLNQSFNISNSSEIDFQSFLAQHNLLLTKSFQLTNDSTFQFNQFIHDINVIKKIVNESSKGSPEAKDYLTHELDNLTSFVKGVEMGMSENVPFRDKKMAENLIWLIDKYYPNEKVIIWTANLHAAKKLNQAIYEKGDDRYQNLTTLAQHLSEIYGENNVYSIACTSTEGSTNSGIGAVVPISLSQTSWDYNFAQEFHGDYAFIDYSQIRKSEFGNKEFESTVLGYIPHIGKWYNIFDGIIFIREMKPSTYK